MRRDVLYFLTEDSHVQATGACGTASSRQFAFQVVALRRISSAPAIPSEPAPRTPSPAPDSAAIAAATPGTDGTSTPSRGRPSRLALAPRARYENRTPRPPPQAVARSSARGGRTSSAPASAPPSPPKRYPRARAQSPQSPARLLPPSA